MPEKSGVRWTASANGLGGILGILCALMGTTARATASTLWKIVSLPLTLLGPAKGVSLFIVRGAWSALKFAFAGLKKSVAFVCGGAWLALKHAKAVIPAGRALWKFTETASVGACKFFGKCCRGAWSALKFTATGARKSAAFACGGVLSLLKHTKAVIPAGRALWKFTETASVGAGKFFGKCCRGAWSALKFAFAGLKKSVAFVCGGVWSLLKKISAVPFAIVCAAKGVSLRLVSGAWSLLKHAKAVIPAGRTLWKFTETASVCACKFFGKCCRGAWSALKFAFAGLKKSVAFVCGGVWSPLKKISAVPFAIVCAAKGVSLRLVSGAWSLLKHAKAVIPAVQSLWKFTKAAAKLASCFGAKCCVKIAPLLRKAYPFFCALLRRCWAFLRTWTVRVGVQLLALLHCVARVPSAGYRLLLKFSMAPRESIAMALQRLRRLRVHGAATEKKAPSSDSAVKLSPLKRIAASRVVPSFHPKNFAKLCKGLPLLPLRFAGKIAKFIGEKTIFVATKLMDTLFGTASVAKSVCSKSATAAKSIGPHAAAISNYARVALLMPAKLRLIAFLAICRNYAVGCASAAKNIGHKSLKFSRNGSMRCAGFAWNFLRILWRIAAKVAVFSLVQLRSAFSLCAAGVRKLCLCVASACSRFRLLLARQFESGWTQILNLVQRPAIVLPIAFTVITFLGLYTYDRQVLRMEYGKAKYAARQSKNLLRQKRHAMRGYTDENPSPRRKVRSSNGKHAAALGAATIKTADDLQRAVDEFFSHHVVSQIMCDGGSCRMKIDNKIVGDHGMLGENSGVFVAEADDDCVTFTDALGNRYSKTIASLLGL